MNLDKEILCSQYRCLLRNKCSRSTSNHQNIEPNVPVTELQNISETECNFYLPLVAEHKTNIDGNLLLS